MRVLWVFAHPEPRSLNGALRDEGIAWLGGHGHQVAESDLYAMGWNPVVSAADFRAADSGAADSGAADSGAAGSGPGGGRLDVLTESERAYRAGTLSGDIRREQAKLCWADTLVVQFPLWWFGPSAILKGWFDRLFVQGYAQGVPDPATGRPLRYGSGGLAGRRALVVTTVGAGAATTGPRGIHGDINDILFPLLHGTLWYTGMTVVPPLVVNGTVALSAAGYQEAAARLRTRLAALPDTAPIPFRSQNGGDYDEHLVLRPDRARGREGIRVHYAAPGAARE